MIEKEKFERHLRGRTSRKTRFHRISLPSNSMEGNTMMLLRKSCESTRYG